MEMNTEVPFEDVIKLQILSSKIRNEYKLIKEWYTRKDWPLEIRSWVPQKKNDQRAEEIKNMGNSVYTRRDFCTAFELYTNALLFAKYNSAMYGIILSNMSGCLYEMRNFKKCVTFIDACFSTAYPDTSRPKLHVRKIKALRSLGKKSCVEEALSDLKKLLNKSKVNPAEKEKYLQLTQHMTKEESEINILEDYDYVFDLPKFVQNPKIINISAHATLRFNKKNGRHIVAEKMIKKGECILMEKPYATLGFARCPNCFSNIENIIPCNNCPGIMYCSEVCKGEDYEVHKWECKFYQLGKFRALDPRIRLAFRVFLKGLQGGYQTNSKKVEENLQFGNKTDNFPYIRQLAGNFLEMSLPLKLLSLDGCCVLLACINMDTSLKNWIENIIGNDMYLIGKNLLQLITICDVNIIKLNTHIANSYHLFLSTSLFNHSCVPNAVFCYQEDRIVMRATKEIRPGEQIYINYLFKEIDQLTRIDRKKLLKTFSINCCCTLCTSEDENIIMLPCPKCKSYSDVIVDGVLACKTCGRTTIGWDKTFKMSTIQATQEIYAACKDINVLHEGIKVANEMGFKPDCGFMVKLYNDYIIECIRFGQL